MAKWNAGRIMLACASYFKWIDNYMMPEFEFDGGRADLVFVTRSRYATEIEIKISLTDWNCDRDKAKWKQRRPFVSRFFYAIPETLKDKIPDWVSADTGIIVCYEGKSRDFIRVARESKRVKANKVSEEYIRQMHLRCYYRFWLAELKRRRKFREELHK